MTKYIKALRDIPGHPSPRILVAVMDLGPETRRPQQTRNMKSLDSHGIGILSQSIPRVIRQVRRAHKQVLSGVFDPAPLVSNANTTWSCTGVYGIVHLP